MRTIFCVSLGIAQHGWLPITFSTEHGDVFELAASRVLNDPLSELVDVAVALVTKNAVNAAVRIWEEPGTTELRVISGLHDSSVIIEIAEVSDWPGKTSPHSLLKYRGECERSALANSIIATLRAFEMQLPRTGEIDGWGTFPSMKFRRVAPEPSERLFLAPWRETRGQQRIVDELRSEVGRAHPLFGLDVAVVGHHGDTDDYLFELATGPDALAVVRLTWSGKREKDPNSPKTEFFSSWSDWVQRRLLPDANGRSRDEE
jgi:hypothetical protein